MSQQECDRFPEGGNNFIFFDFDFKDLTRFIVAHITEGLQHYIDVYLPNLGLVVSKRYEVDCLQVFFFPLTRV